MRRTGKQDKYGGFISQNRGEMRILFLIILTIIWLLALEREKGTLEIKDKNFIFMCEITRP